MNERIERARELDAEGCWLPDSITGRTPLYGCERCGDQSTRADREFEFVWCLNCGKHFKKADAAYMGPNE